MNATPALSEYKDNNNNNKLCLLLIQAQSRNDTH